MRTTSSPQPTASVFQEISSNVAFECGASINGTVGELRIIKFEYYFVSPDRSFQVRVVAGKHSADAQSSHEQIRLITQINIHPNYSRETLENDIAILKVLRFPHLPIGGDTVDPPRRPD